MLRLSLSTFNRWKRTTCVECFTSYPSPHRYAHRAGWELTENTAGAIFTLRNVPIWQKQAPSNSLPFFAPSQNMVKTAHTVPAANQLFEVAPERRRPQHAGVGPVKFVF